MRFQHSPNPPVFVRPSRLLWVAFAAIDFFLTNHLKLCGLEPPFYFAYNIEGQEFGSLAGWRISDHMALAGRAGMGGPLPFCLLTPKAWPLSISLSVSPWCLTLWGLSAWLGLLTAWLS